jgi:hypothetical protein
MKMRRRLSAVVVALLGTAIVAVPSFTFGADEGLRLAVGPGRLVFLTGSQSGPTTSYLHVEVSGSTAATVATEVSDAVPDSSGGWSKAPAGSTPYSLNSVVTIDPETIDYKPNGTKQTFEVAVTVNLTPSEVPHAGFIGVSLTPVGEAPDSGGIKQVVAIETAAVTGPAAGAGGELPAVAPALSAGGIVVSQKGSWTPIDAVLPDLIAGLIDHGPANVTATHSNSGDVVLDTQTKVSFAGVGPLAFLPGSSETGAPFYTWLDRSRFSLPGQSTAIAATSEVPLDNASPIDSLPLIGFVRVTATTTGTLGALTAVPITQSVVILVFPWKELLALILLLVVLQIVRIVLRRGWRRLRGRGKSKQPVDVQDVAADGA